MDNLLSKDTYQELISDIRFLKEKFFTNFFWNDDTHNQWIEHHELSYAKLSERTVLIFRKNDGFKNLYYITANLDDLGQQLKIWSETNKECYVCDIVGREKDIEPLQHIFSSIGFSICRMLKRMVRVKDISDLSPVENNYISYASYDDISAIHEILETFFDKYSEQLPTEYELQKQIDKHGVILYKEASKIGGIVIFDDLKATMQLKYWLVLPEFRDKHIGTLLYNAMMYDCRNAKRQMHWVVSDNDNAIKRYLHYGYKFDSLIDTILLKQKF